MYEKQIETLRDEINKLAVRKDQATKVAEQCEREIILRQGAIQTYVKISNDANGEITQEKNRLSLVEKE
jgi:hypothetical protein